MQFDTNADTAVILSEDSGDGYTEAVEIASTPRQGVILPKSADFRLINKAAKRGIWPDSPIRKEQGFAGGLGLHYSVLIQDADGNEHMASRQGNLLSPDYLLVTNEEIKQMAHDVAILTGYDFEPVRERFDVGRNGGSSYEYLMRAPGLLRTIGGSSVDVNGDNVCVGLRALNSYDKSTKARVEMFAERLVCSNGMMRKDGLFSFQFQHKVSSNGGRTQWEEELQRAQYELRHLSVNLEQFVDQLARLREIPVGTGAMTRFTEKLPSSFPASTYGEIVRRFYEFEEPTAFGLLNACTYVTWHRGNSVTDADMGRNEDLVELMTSDLFLN